MKADSHATQEMMDKQMQLMEELKKDKSEAEKRYRQEVERQRRAQVREPIK
jgi:hypothetical protein